MFKKEKETEITEDKMLPILDELYGKALNGIPKVSKSVDELANDYLLKNPDPETAARKLINGQITKCGASGFLSGLGGVLTLPVALPANVTSVLYVQLRMIAAVAVIGGFDVHSDQVETMVYACLTGQSIVDVVKPAGIMAGQKFAMSAIGKIPGSVLTTINKAVGFRLFTKFGTKGVVNFVKLVPAVGGIIGGVADAATTKVIAQTAYNVFIRNEIPSDSDKKNVEDDVIFDAEFQDAGED